MHFTHNTPVVRGLRYCDQLLWRSRGIIASARPATMDAAVILILSAMIFVVEHLYHLAPMLFQFAMDHEEWEIDNIIFVAFIMSIGFAIFSYRRLKELSVEMKACRSAELEAKRLARHDPLTGLPNRRFFLETLGEILQATTANSQTAVLMLDLDGFKTINDAYGHAVGDQVLVEFTQRISALIRSGEIFIRVGGDKFAVIGPVH